MPTAICLLLGIVQLLPSSSPGDAWCLLELHVICGVSLVLDWHLFFESECDMNIVFGCILHGLQLNCNKRHSSESESTLQTADGQTCLTYRHDPCNNIDIVCADFVSSEQLMHAMLSSLKCI